ncbi:MAG: hypothetical protein QOE70_6523 [Chthoniobacter sp.]|jgi:uncharacterized protein YbdZ (MbtH family)|nr:hypothetical protein [Chthoniobacter sp.]
MNRSGLLIALFVLASVLRCAAEPEMVIVPYDPKKPAAEQKPDRLYLPYERFLQLWEAAKQQRRPVPLASSSAPWVLSGARYDGVIGEQSVGFTGKLDLLTTNEPWVKVPLAFGNARISALLLDGVAANFDGKEIVVEKPGRHILEVSFEVPLPRQATKFSFNVPPATATLVSLTLRDAQGRAAIEASGIIERLVGDRKVVTAAVGAASQVRVELLPAATSLRVAEAASASIRSAVTVRPGVEQISATIAFAFPGARQDRFVILLDPDLVLAKIEAADVKSWRLAPQGDRQALEITLNEPVEGAYELLLEADRPLPALPLSRRATQVSAAAGRVEYAATALFADARVELIPQPAPGQRQVEWKGEPIARARFVAAFAGAGPLGWRAALKEPQREARVDYVYQVNRRKIELIASLQLTVKDDDLFAVTLALPPEFTVQAVQSPRLQDWWLDEQTLHVRFKDETPKTTPLVVYLVRQYAAAPTELEVRPLTLAGFQRITGEAVIAAHKGVDAALTLNAEAREVAPDRVAGDFKILPPLERKRGFTFKTQGFSGQVKLAALAAKWNALWVQHAQAHEGWIALSTRTRLTVRQGSLEAVTFTLPAALPEARVTGGEVRETRSRVEGAQRVYEVQFQNDVYDTVEFTLDLELPNPGSVALPAIAWPGAQFVSGYVLADNASEYEMRLETSGVDPAPTSEIPFLPVLSKNASVFRVQPGWSVKVAAERLEKAESRAAFVAYAELVTALRRDGTEWHRATYHLQNRSLQFLPVILPAGAELMGARVAGQSVRADSGNVGGKPVILVPLIKTKPGDLSYDVELVYRRNGREPGAWSTARLDDPELPGITVERTLWDVWLPDDRELQSVGGNMQPVLAEVNKTEKTESRLEELKKLVSVASSNTWSYEVRQKSLRNIVVLKKSIEEDTKSEGRGRGEYDMDAEVAQQKGLKQKESSSQRLEVAGKKQQIAKQLEEQTRRADEVAKNLSQEAQQTPQSQQIELNGLAQVPGVRLENQSFNTLNNAAPGQAGAIQQLAVGDRWAANGTMAQPATPKPSVQIQSGNNQLFLNDNIVLEQRVIVPAERQRAEQPDYYNKTITPQFRGNVEQLKQLLAEAEGFSSAGRYDLALKRAEQILSLDPYNIAARKLQEKVNKETEKYAASSQSETRAKALKEVDQAWARPLRPLDLNQAKAALNEPAKTAANAGQPQMQAREQLFNTARGNNAYLAQQATQVESSPRPAEQPAPNPANPPPALPPGQASMPPAAAPPAVRLPVPLTEGTTPSAPLVVGGRLGGGGGSGIASRPSDSEEEQRVQAQGRISLAIDFPTEGQVFHFKKLKAHAELEITSFAPSAFARWKWLALAAGCAVVLILGERWLSRRRHRRAKRGSVFATASA